MNKLIKETANDFINVLQDWLTEDEFLELQQRTEQNKNSNICYSHDYCDANIAMLEATGRRGIDSEDLDTINKIWDVARSNNFNSIR